MRLAIYKQPLVYILIVSLTVRLLFLLFIPATPDDATYRAIIAGFSLANGHGLHIDADARWRRQLMEAMNKVPKPQRKIQLEDISIPENVSLTEPNTIYPPGHAVFLAIFFRLTGQARYVYPEAAALLIDALVPTLLLYFLGKRLFNRRVGLVAAALYSVWLPFVFIAAQARPEQLLSSVSLGLLVSVFMFSTQRKIRWLAAMAALVAVAVNLRSDMASTIPFLAVAAAMATKGTFKARAFNGVMVGALLVLTAIVSLVPYGLLQKERFGEFNITSLALGVAAWQGIGEYPNRWGAVLSDADTEGLLASHGLEFNSPAGERFLLAKVQDAFQEDPLWFIGSFAKRALHILTLEYYWAVQLIQIELDIPGENVAAHCQTWNVLPGGSITCWSLALAYIGIVVVQVTSFLDWSLWVGTILGVVIFRKRPYVWFLLVLPLARLIPFSFIHVERRYILYGMGPSLVYLAALIVHGWTMRTSAVAALRSRWPWQKPAAPGTR